MRFVYMLDTDLTQTEKPYQKFNGLLPLNVYDYSLYRLKYLLKFHENNKASKKTISKMIEDYQKGIIQISWIEGVPNYKILSKKKKSKS